MIFASRLLLDPDDAAALPAVLRSFVRFAGERTGLDTAFVDEILAAVDEAEPQFQDRIGDPGAADPAKAVHAALRASGVDSDDLDAVDATPIGSTRPSATARSRRAQRPTCPSSASRSGGPSPPGRCARAPDELLDELVPEILYELHAGGTSRIRGSSAGHLTSQRLGAGGSGAPGSQFSKRPAMFWARRTT